MACRYENIVQVRCLLEGTATEDILDNWHTILPDKMRQWSLDRAEVHYICTFILIDESFSKWALNQLYNQNWE